MEVDAGTEAALVADNGVFGVTGDVPVDVDEADAFDGTCVLEGCFVYKPRPIPRLP